MPNSAQIGRKRAPNPWAQRNVKLNILHLDILNKMSIRALLAQLVGGIYMARNVHFSRYDDRRLPLGTTRQNWSANFRHGTSRAARASIWLLLPIAICWPAESAPTGEISQSDLIRLGTQAIQYKQPDVFSPPFNDSSALDRSFRISIPMKPSGIPSMPDRNGGWTYDPDHQRLTLTVEANLWTAQHRPSGDLSFTIVRGFELSNVVQQLGHQREQNAFGARVDVRYARMKSVGIAAITPEAQAASIQFSRDWNVLSYQLTVPPERARMIVKNLKTVVEGRVVSLENEHTSICDEDGASATYSSPTSVSERFCIFNAEIVHVSIQSGAGVLADWRSPGIGGAPQSAAANTMTSDKPMIHQSFGVHFAMLGPEQMRVFKAASEHGVLVVLVDPLSPADRAGVRSGDVITQFADREVISIEDLQSAVAAVPSGGAVTVRLLRDGKEIGLTARFN